MLNFKFDNEILQPDQLPGVILGNYTSRSNPNEHSPRGSATDSLGEGIAIAEVMAEEEKGSHDDDE